MRDNGLGGVAEAGREMNQSRPPRGFAGGAWGDPFEITTKYGERQIWLPHFSHGREDLCVLIDSSQRSEESGSE